ncbi:hypothetical protein EV426DRAFT_102680 [Tirmania nivea]|nr:hypothetical protein EV426DRAFT_102680 [Tirmania nivea]
MICFIRFPNYVILLMLGLQSLPACRTRASSFTTRTRPFRRSCTELRTGRIDRAHANAARVPSYIMDYVRAKKQPIPSPVLHAHVWWLQPQLQATNCHPRCCTPGVNQRKVES